MEKKHVLSILAELEKLVLRKHQIQISEAAFLDERNVTDKPQSVFEGKLPLSKNFISCTELNHSNAKAFATFGSHKTEGTSSTLNMQR